MDEDLGDLPETILAALDHAGIGMTVTVESGGSLRSVFVSEAASRLLGAAAPGEGAAGALDRAARTKLAALEEKRLSGEDDGRAVRLDVSTSDGRRIPIEVSIATARHDGRPATVTFIRDVSEQVSIAERLRSSESRFRTFTEASPDAIHVLRDGQLLYMNPAAKRLFGGIELGTELGEIVHGDDVAVLSDRMDRILAGEALRPYEYRLIHPSGEVVTVEISSIPIEYEGAPCLLGFGRDVTERKRMQGRLIQADRMATVGTLATGVAHEINNPLTYVVLHLEKLRMSLTRLVPDEKGRGEAHHMLAEALDGAERVRVIVQDLLSLARSDTSTHGPTDVRKVVGTALKLASPVLDGRAEVVPELEETAPVRANAAWLGQVFVNLLVNAGQAFGKRPASQNRVRAITGTDEEGWALVTIEDNGPGIPTDIVDRIFDPFFTTKEAGTGTGLGLAISRSVIDSLGGEIRRTEPAGQGHALPGASATSVAHRAHDRAAALDPREHRRRSENRRVPGDRSRLRALAGQSPAKSRQSWMARRFCVKFDSCSGSRCSSCSPHAAARSRELRTRRPPRRRRRRRWRARSERRRRWLTSRPTTSRSHPYRPSCDSPSRIRTASTKRCAPRSTPTSCPARWWW